MSGKTLCPRCGKPVVRFDIPSPAETGTTCNPINSPDCWFDATAASSAVVPAERNETGT